MSDARRDADAVLAGDAATVDGGASAAAYAAAGRGHESRDVRIRPIVLAFVALFVVAIVVHVLMYVVLYGFTAREERASAPESPLAAYGRRAPPEPRLQIAPRDDLDRLHTREGTLLNGYAWIDRDAGVVRIPVERAIDLLAARGLPSAPEAAGESRVPEPERAGSAPSEAENAAPAPDAGATQ